MDYGPSSCCDNSISLPLLLLLLRDHQFCGNNPEEILQAALLVQDMCDAVDCMFAQHSSGRDVEAQGKERYV